MHDHDSTKAYYRTPRTTQALIFWWHTRRRRPNSDTASIIPRPASTNGESSRRLSVPYIIPPRALPRPKSLSHSRRPKSEDRTDDINQRNKTHQSNFSTITIDESAVSDTSVEDIIETQSRDRLDMADRTMRQAERLQASGQDERRERVLPRTSRNADTNTISTSTLASEPSLFEACHELQRRNVKVSLPSLSTLSSLNNTPSGITASNQQTRQANPLLDPNRISVPSYPDHLLNLPPEPSFKDICLKTVLNAGATVEFIPRTTNFSAVTETYTCEDCGKKFHNEGDWDSHLSREKSYCPFCDGKFDCHGILLRHSCNSGRN